MDRLEGSAALAVRALGDRLQCGPDEGAMPAMKAAIRILLLGLAVALASVPVGIVLAVFLAPFWSLLEATIGVESIGHSGPAVWCFLVTIALVFCGITALLRLLMRMPDNTMR